MNTYTIEDTGSAIIVRESVPAGLFAHLAQWAQEEGHDRLDAGLAQALGASFVITNAAGSERLRAEHEAGITETDPVKRWLQGCDTGISSSTMVMAICGPHVWNQDLTPCGPDVPHDSADFGRCVRLLEACPHLRPQLHKVAERYPAWAPLVEHWDEVEALYREDLAANWKTRGCYDRLRELLFGEGSAK